MSDNNLQCVVCKQNIATGGLISGKDSSYYKCPACGNYEITESLLYTNELERSDLFILSGVVRNASAAGKTLVLSTSNIEALIKNAIRPQSQHEYLMWTLRLLGDRATSFFESINISPQTDYSIVFCRTADEFKTIIKNLQKLKYVEEPIDKSWSNLSLTTFGWQKYEELKQEKIAYPKLVFMAMKYNEPKHDAIYKEKFKPAVGETGFELRRLDEQPSAGLIDNRLRVDIRNCRFLLADVTGKNHGAYWEAGYAEGLGKKVIYLCNKKDFDENKAHFDVNHSTTITWDEENIKDAVGKLKATIRATFPSEAIMIDEDSTDQK